MSRFETRTSGMIMKQLRRIKEDACCREPKKVVKKVISLNKFVNEFEWLDTRYTQWFMEKTSKSFHGKLMEELRRKEESKRRLKSQGVNSQANITPKSDNSRNSIFIDLNH